MNWLDIVLLVLIGLSVVAGVKRGFARTGLGLLSLVVALLCSLWFYRLVGGWVNEFVTSVRTANLIGFAIIMTVILVAGGVLGVLLERLMRAAHLSWLDRLLGGAFGLVRGVLLAAVILLALMAFSTKPPPRSVLRSNVAPYVVDAARAMAAAAPHELKEGFRESYQKAREMWDKTLKKRPRKLPEQTI